MLLQQSIIHSALPPNLAGPQRKSLSCSLTVMGRIGRTVTYLTEGRRADKEVQFMPICKAL